MKYTLFNLKFVISIALALITLAPIPNSNNKTFLTKQDAINIIKSYDKNYDVIITDDNYKVNGRYYYVLHSNLTVDSPIELNKPYSDIFEINGETFFRVHTTYSNSEIYSGYRYCLDKETGEIYIEYVDSYDYKHTFDKNHNNNSTYINSNKNTFIKYTEYNECLLRFAKLLKKNNLPLDSHIDVTIKDNIYSIHLFSIVYSDKMSFTRTSAWYDFNIITEELKNILTEELY